MPTAAQQHRSPRHAHHRLVIAALWLGVLVQLVGCVAPSDRAPSLDRRIYTAARPLLELDPNADWTACYNSLVDLAPASLEFLASTPAMTRRAAPDDLSVVLNVSLLHLLASPVHKPRISLTAYETTLDVLHFAPKVLGRSLGEVRIVGPPPRSWLDLYPTSFDHKLAEAVDIDADREAMLAWWTLHRGDSESPATWLRLHSNPEHLWTLLRRRPADRWTYMIESGPQLCAVPALSAPLIDEVTSDYNLIRAACIQLGRSPRPDVRDRLIDTIAHPSAVAAHNARFALQHNPDPEIRALVSEYTKNNTQ